MSERDYNRQVEKRQRACRTTLVVGVDVGNAFRIMQLGSFLLQRKKGTTSPQALAPINSSASRDGHDGWIEKLKDDQERTSSKSVCSTVHRCDASYNCC